MFIVDNKKTKKIIKTILIIVLIALAVFLFVKYGIALRQLEKEEIAEQIEKLGYYRPDYHINADRELLEHKYQLFIGIPMLITLMITIPMLFINIFGLFTSKEDK